LRFSGTSWARTVPAWVTGAGRAIALGKDGSLKGKGDYDPKSGETAKVDDGQRWQIVGGAGGGGNET